MPAPKRRGSQPTSDSARLRFLTALSVAPRIRQARVFLVAHAWGEFHAEPVMTWHPPLDLESRLQEHSDIARTTYFLGPVVDEISLDSLAPSLQPRTGSFDHSRTKTVVSGSLVDFELELVLRGPVLHSLSHRYCIRNSKQSRN